MWISLTLEQAFQSSGILLLVCFLVAPLSAHIVAKISRERILTIFGYITLIYPYAFLLEALFAYILTIGIATYPVYLRLVMKPFWDSFLNISLLSFVLSALNLAIFQIFVTPLWVRRQQVIPLVDMRWGRKAKRCWRDKFSSFKWSIKRRLTITRMLLFTKKKSIIGLGLVLSTLAPLIVIPLDQKFYFLTPKLQASEEKLFSVSWMNRQLILTRIETWKGVVYQYYELKYRSYNVTLPTFPYHVNSICIANPSNFSKEADSGRLHPFLGSWGDIDNLWVSSNNNISFLFQPDSKEVKEMIIDFSNATSRMISFNVTYYQQFLTRNVTVKEEIELGEYQNDTRSEIYYFYVYNNENATLKIPYFELHRLAFEVVDIDTVEVYMNNQLDPLVSVDRHAIYPLMIVPPYAVGNLTITLLSRRE